jgi:hypothetical protein
MTPREPDNSLWELLSRHYTSLRSALVLREGLRAAGRTAVVIALGVALGVAWPSGEPLAWARTVAVLAAFAVALAMAVASLLRALPSFDGFLERVEGRFPAVRSWLRNALDFERRPPAHTSPELARALSRETALRLEDVPLATLRPAVEARRPIVMMAVSLVVVAALGAALPSRTDRSWHTLLDPRSAAPPVRLEVEPGSVTVSPGVALAVHAHVWGTAARPRLLREGLPGLAGTRMGEGSRGERLWRFDLTQLTHALDYRVRVAHVESPRYRISLAGTPQPVSFEIEIRPPAYARLPVQRGAATRGDLSALRGSRARVEVLFDRDLAALEVTLPGGTREAWNALNPRRWRGEIGIRREGEYVLHARASGREGHFRYSVQPLADAPPILTVRVPRGDVDLPAGGRIPYEVLGQDDLGLTELRLQTRKDPDSSWTNLTLARFEDEPREAHVAEHWDATPLALLPGESAAFRFLLFDDAALEGRGVAISPTYELRFPSLAELYGGVDDRQEAAQEALERVAEQAKELQKSLDKLARQAPTRADGSPRSFERQEEVKRAMDRHQDLSQRIEDASSQLRKSLEQAAERRAFDDQLTRKLRELAELMDQIQSKEFRDAMRRLQEALQNLEQRPNAPTLRDWRRQNEQMLNNLERTIELLKRLREEERLQALSQRAQELKERQDALNRRLGQAKARDAESREQEDRELAEEQKRSAAESEQLAKDAEQLGGEMNDPQARSGLEEAAHELERQAAPAQREAGDAVARRQRDRARRSGERASQSLQRAAETLSSLAGSILDSRHQLDVAAVRRSAQDLVSLQRAAERNLDSRASSGERADRQSDLSEGTARVADSLSALSQKTPFIGPRLSEALGRAINDLQQSGRKFQQGDRSGGEMMGHSASSALVQAVLELRRTEASMCQSSGTSKPGGSAPMRVAELGQRQEHLNEETRNLAERLTQQMRLSAGDRDELERLAGEQARLRKELERIAQEEERRRQLLGRLDETAEEMREVEEALRQGTLGDEVERKQQRILSRLLDAQRSVYRQDFDPRRESRPGEDAVRASPPDLPADMLREGDRLRLGLLKAQADRYPAQYRAFIEAYLRALHSGGTR